MKYYLVAGEASGDLHGANLMAALKAKDPQAEFRFFGGNLMQAEGGTLVKHYAEMAFMGFVEVALNLRTILKNMKTCKEDISLWQPDVVILIDFPGFNLKIAAFCKEHGLPVFYYISPKVWAWNQKRVLKIKKVVDKMFCILPFEVDFYKSWGMDVDYIGNPLLDAVFIHQKNENFLSQNNLSQKPIVALLPGSRRQELKGILPDMLQITDQFPDYQFVIAGAPSFSAEDYASFTGIKPVPVIFNQTYDLLENASAALVASGTATLETALFRVPQVVLYKGNAITIAIARALIKIRFISLVNLIMDREIVKELIQADCTPQKISNELKQLLHDQHYRQKMLDNYVILNEKMGKPGASAKTAELMIGYLQK
ncbi:MAG: lipid-A-disaccharide synthase [Sphingobacteriaceae bacterium]|nr:MAG: lipid-A-disaccharide synthase [Sphingobacteriaceae bacterium]